MKSNWIKRQQLLGYLFIAPNMIGILLFFFIPAVMSLVLTFTNWNFASKEISFIGLGNFVRLFQDEVFYQSIYNTMIYLLSVPVSIFLALLVATVINYSVFFKKLLRGMYFMPYITSGVAVAFVWMLLFEPKDGPINQFLMWIGVNNPPGWLSSSDTVMLAYDIIWIWFLLGFNMIIYLAALQEISPDLLEAAKIDGARPWHTFRYIIVPLVSPSTLLLLITGFINTIKTFGIIEAVTGGGPGTSSYVLSLQMYKTAFRYYEIGYAGAISWVLFSIVLVITVVQWISQKKWVHY